MQDKVQIPATLTRVSSRVDGSLSLGFSTQEMTAEEKVVAMKFQGKFGFLFFSESELQPLDIPKSDPEFEGKTQSQRLRGVMFVLHKQLKRDGKTTLSFEDFYRGQIESLIEQYKTKLDS